MGAVANGMSTRRRAFAVISASVPVLIFAQVLLAGLSIYYD